MTDPERAGASRAPMDRFLAGLAERAVRTRPGLLLPAPRVLVVAAWAMSIALAWVTLLPFRFPAVELTVDVAPLVLDAPPWFRVMVVAGLGLLSACLHGVLALRRGLAEHAARKGAILTALLALPLLATAIVPVAAAIRADSPVLAALAGAAAITAAAMVVAGGPRRARDTRWLAVTAASAGLVWWSVVPLGAGDGPAAAPLWTAVSILVVVAVLVGGFAGLASAAIRRSALVRDALSVERSRTVVTVALLVVAAVLTLRLTVARHLFSALDAVAGAADAEIWQLRSWTTWPLSVIVAALIVMYALRSQTAPRRPFGTRAVILVLTAGFSVAGAVLVITAVDELLAPLRSQPVIDLSPIADAYSFVLVAASLALVAFIVLPSFRATTARAMSVVGVIYLVPGTAGAPLTEAFPWLPPFWAAPVTVVVAITAIVAVIVVGQWFGRFAGVSRSALLRLLVYPVIVLHAATLLPAALDGGFASAIGVLLLVVGVVLLMPRVAADRLRHSHTVLVAAAGTLFGLLGIVLAARSEAWLGLTTVLALLMLAVPVMTGLVIRGTPAHE